MESGCSRSQLRNTAPKGQRSSTVADMEEDRLSRRHQRSSRQGSKSRTGLSSGNVDQRFHGSVTATSLTPQSSLSSSSSTSVPAVRHPTCNRHELSDSLQFYSPEVATNSTSSLPAETSSVNPPRVAESIAFKTGGGLVRRKSDLGPIAESDKVCTSNVEEVASRSLRRSGIQPPGAVVRHRGDATSSRFSSVPEPEQNDGEKQNLRTSSSTDARSLGGASRPSANDSSTLTGPRVLALSDHITCLRQKNLRRRDDVITSGGHVSSNGACEPDADGKCVNGERYG